jgi:penicillin-binding protein 1A
MQQGGKVEGTFANSDHIITIQKMLNEVTQNGTGAAMKYYSSGYNVIGKTGTTQNQSDGWYIGALPEVCVGAWVGTLDKRIHFKSLGLGSGANTALPIVGRVFADLALWRTPIITNFSWDKEKFDCPEYQNSTAEEAMKRIYSDSSNIESFVPVSEEGKIDSLLIPLEKDSLQ